MLKYGLRTEMKEAHSFRYCTRPRAIMLRSLPTAKCPRANVLNHCLFWFFFFRFFFPLKDSKWNGRL